MSHPYLTELPLPAPPIYPSFPGPFRCLFSPSPWAKTLKREQQKTSSQNLAGAIHLDGPWVWSQRTYMLALALFSVAAQPGS